MLPGRCLTLRSSGEHEVANAGDLAVGPVQQDEEGRLVVGIVGIEHQDGRSSVHQSGDAAPVDRRFRVAVIVNADRLPSRYGVVEILQLAILAPMSA